MVSLALHTMLPWIPLVMYMLQIPLTIVFKSLLSILTHRQTQLLLPVFQYQLTPLNKQTVKLVARILPSVGPATITLQTLLQTLAASKEAPKQIKIEYSTTSISDKILLMTYLADGDTRTVNCENS